MARKATLQIIEGTAHRGVRPSPELDIVGFRGLYALCTTDEAEDGTTLLRAVNWAACQIGGSRPIWAVWAVNGRFQRFFGSRGQIERAYPQLVWRRKMCSWRLLDTNDLSIAARRDALARIYHHDIDEEASTHD